MSYVGGVYQVDIYRMRKDVPDLFQRQNYRKHIPLLDALLENGSH